MVVTNLTDLYCFLPSNQPTPQNDVWALGVMALEAVTGCHPFSPDHCHYENVLYSIAHCNRVNLPSNLSPEFTDWLEQVSFGVETH